MRIQAGHRDTTVGGQVYVVFLDERLALLRRQPSEAEDLSAMRDVECQRNSPEHANLVDDMVPVARRLQLLRQQPVQLMAHVNNPPRHRLNILLPLREQLRLPQDHRHQPRAIRRRVANLAALQHRQLALHPRRRVGALRDDVQRADTLAVQTRVLCEGLADEQRDALGGEVAHRPRVRVEVAGCEALVSTVEEGVVRALLHDARDRLPLLVRGVDASGVVRACVEEDDRLGRRVLHGAKEAVEVEADSLRVVVGVCHWLNANIAEDVEVVD